MGKDRNWPFVCTLMGCTNKELRGHHHHMHRGHLQMEACQCESVGEPGTRPKEK